MLIFGATFIRSSLGVLAVFVLTGADKAPAQSAAPNTQVFTFDKDRAGTLPKGFRCGMTGTWKATKWQVRDFKGGRVFGHFGIWDEDPDGVFPLCWVEGTLARDLTLSVRLYPVRPPAGVAHAIHDGAGIIVRFKDPDNYYLMRAVPHEQRVRLYKVENGRRTTLGGKDLDIGLGQWHELKLQVRDDLFTLSFDGEKLFHLFDSTFSGTGSFGLWSKPNNDTLFDDLKAEIVN